MRDMEQRCYKLFKNVCLYSTLRDENNFQICYVVSRISVKRQRNLQNQWLCKSSTLDADHIGFNGLT